MKQVDLNFEIENLDGAPIGNAGQLVANLLMSETKGEAVKFFDWAMTFNKKTSVQMDDADLSKLKSILVDTEKVTLLAKAQLLKYIETLK